MNKDTKIKDSEQTINKVWEKLHRLLVANRTNQNKSPPQIYTCKRMNIIDKQMTK